MNIRRKIWRGLLAATTAAVLGAAAQLAWATSFIVQDGGDGIPDMTNNTPCTDHGSQCTLRDALAEGNLSPGPHTIDIGVPLVSLNTGGGLELKQQFTISGMATGSAPLTTIDGYNGGSHVACFSIDEGTGNGSIIQNLVIIRCAGAGISSTAYGVQILNNYIGTDGTVTSYGNMGDGISMNGAATAYGLDPLALEGMYQVLPPAPIDPATSDAYAASFFASLAQAITPLSAPNYIKNNVISGNQGDGIALSGANLAGVIVAGNYIGTDPTGTFKIANAHNGISLVATTFGNFIGPAGSTPGNTIGGNGGSGIYVNTGPVSLPNFIMGNRIGLPMAKSSGNAVGNDGSGIYVGDARPDTSSGNPSRPSPTTMPLWIGPRNLIGGNGVTPNPGLDNLNLSSDEAGIYITGSMTTGVQVTGNTIGIAEFAGVADQSTQFGNPADGIIVTADHNTIGGTWPADANIIAGNGRHGIVVSGAIYNTIRNNYIGKHPLYPADTTLGNAGDGIYLTGTANATTIGGTDPADANLIAANGRNGVRSNGGGYDGWGNLLQRNVIFGNAQSTAGVGIDIDHPVNAADDPTVSEIPANYGNLDQAQPVLCQGSGSAPCSGANAPFSSGGTTTIDWGLSSHGPAVFRVEFFAIDNADDSLATSMKFLDETVVSTDALLSLSSSSGNSTCTGNRCTTIVGGASGGKYVIATATDVTPMLAGTSANWDSTGNVICRADHQTNTPDSCFVNNTSEFSNTVNITASAPAVTTQAATAVGVTTATLNGTVTANGADTSVTFDYGIMSAQTYDGAASPASPAPGLPSPVTAGQSDIAVSVTLAGLTCATTYRFRVTGDNSVGSAHGFDQPFTTGDCSVSAPTSSTGSATAITAHSATLNGIASAAGAAANAIFQWSLDTSYGNSSPTISLSAGANNQAISTDISGLQCNKLYHFRLQVDNGSGPVNGSEATFTTAACSAAAPVATTGAASAITATSATVSGLVDANNASTTVTFQYGVSGYANSVPTAQPAFTTNKTSVTAGLTGLSCNTTYQYRVVADNGVGLPVPGNGLTFTTAACPLGAPTATTGSASGISATSATLNGTVSANGSSTAVAFEYGISTAYGSTAPVAGSVTGQGVAVSAGVSLACGTNYYYRVTANNGTGGTVTGGPSTFVTASCPLNQTVAFSSTAPSSATVGGATYAPTASATSGLTVAITVDATAATVCSITGGVVSFIGSGSCVLDANQAGNGTYNPAAQVQQSFNVSGAAPTSQTISFGTAPSLILNASAATVSATATSGLTVQFATASSACNVVDHHDNTATVSALSLGTCLITADQPGNVSYAAAPQATQSLNIGYAGTTATNSGTATVTIQGGGATCALSSVSFSLPASPPAGVSFPHGVLNFTASNCTPGGQVTIHVTYPSSVSGASYEKYGPRPPNQPDAWYAMPGAVLSGNTATFTIQDGGIGDDDFASGPNGTIIDAGGPVFSAAGPAGAGAAAIPTLGEWGLIALNFLLMLLVWHAGRRTSMSRDSWR